MLISEKIKNENIKSYRELYGLKVIARHKNKYDSEYSNFWGTTREKLNNSIGRIVEHHAHRHGITFKVIHDEIFCWWESDELEIIENSIKIARLF